MSKTLTPEHCRHGFVVEQCSECEVAVPLYSQPLPFAVTEVALRDNLATGQAESVGCGPELPGYAFLSLESVTAAYEREQKARLYKDWFTPNPLLKLLVQNAEARSSGPRPVGDAVAACWRKALERRDARIAELEAEVSRLKGSVPRETSFDAVEFPVNALRWSR